MIKLACSFIYGSLLTMVFAINTGGMIGQGNLEKELLEVENRITAAYLSKNLEAFFQDSDPEMTAFHASNPYRVDERRQIHDALKTFYKDSSPTGLYKLQSRVQIYGDAAIVTYHFVETGGAENGKLYAYDGKQTDVFIRKNGRWTLVHFHSSRVVKPN